MGRVHAPYRKIGPLGVCMDRHIMQGGPAKVRPTYIFDGNI